MGRWPSKEATLARLTEVAGALFYQRGARAVSVDEISAESGVTKMTIYRRFMSKDQIVEACLHANASRMLGAIDAIDEDPDGPAGRVRAIICFIARTMLSEQGRGLLALNLAVEFPDPNHRVRAISAETVAALRQRLADASRLADRARAEAFADHVVLLIQGACAGCHALGPEASVQALKPAVDAALAFHGLDGARFDAAKTRWPQAAA